MRYISLLRGINVSGRNKVSMADLRSLYEEIGLESVTSYIQTGNVLFDSECEDRAGLQCQIEEAISERYGFHVPVVLITPIELNQISENCPFQDAVLEDHGSKVLVTFLHTVPHASNVSQLLNVVTPPEKLSIAGNTVYLYCPNGYGKTKLSTTFLEAKLGVEATTRNWRTVQKLYELASR